MLFGLTEQLALEVGFLPHISVPGTLVPKCPQKLPVLGPTVPLTNREKGKQPRGWEQNYYALENSYKVNYFIRSYYCLSYVIKMSSLGNHKLTHGWKIFLPGTLSIGNSSYLSQFLLDSRSSWFDDVLLSATRCFFFKLLLSMHSIHVQIQYPKYDCCTLWFILYRT